MSSFEACQGQPICVIGAHLASSSSCRYRRKYSSRGAASRAIAARRRARQSPASGTVIAIALRATPGRALRRAVWVLYPVGRLTWYARFHRAVHLGGVTKIFAHRPPLGDTHARKAKQQYNHRLGRPLRVGSRRIIYHRAVALNMTRALHYNLCYNT